MFYKWGIYGCVSAVLNQDASLSWSSTYVLFDYLDFMYYKSFNLDYT
jgi:hypothetical protein